MLKLTKKIKTLIIGFLILAGITIVGSSVILSPALPSIAHEFHADHQIVGQLIGIFFLGLCLSGLFIGALADMFGRKIVLLSSLSLFIICSSLGFFAPSITHLLILRFFQGFSGAAASILVLVVVKDIFDSRQSAKVFSIAAVAFSLGMPIMPTIGGWISFYGSWRYTFLAPAILMSIALLGLLFVLPETLHPDHKHPAHPRVVFRTYKKLIRSPLFMGYSLIPSLATCTLVLFIAEGPFILMDRYNLTAKDFGYIMMTLACAYATANLINSRIVIALDPRKLVVCGMGIIFSGSLITMISALMGENLIFFLIGIGVMEFGRGFCFSNGLSLALDVFPRSRGSSGALARSLDSFSSFLVVMIAKTFSIDSLLHLACAFTIIPLCFLGSLALIRSHQKYETFPL